MVATLRLTPLRPIRAGEGRLRRGWSHPAQSNIVEGELMWSIYPMYPASRFNHLKADADGSIGLLSLDVLGRRATDYNGLPPGRW